MGNRFPLARLLALGAAMAVLGAGSAAGSAHSDTARAAPHVLTRTAGQVTATLSWRGSFAETKDFRIAIDRAGVRTVDEPVRLRDCGEPAPGFACPWPGGRSPLRVADLDRDGEPEVVVAGFTGGAHCCLVALVYRWAGSAYATTERNFFDPGYRVRDLDRDGRPEFLTADVRFTYFAQAYAESVFPIQILRFDAGHFRAVTEGFEAAIRKDMRRLRKLFRRRAESPRLTGLRPALAAYVADLHLLDRRAKATRVLRSALRNDLLEPQGRFDVGPFGRKFVRKLNRRLDRWGYRE